MRDLRLLSVVAPVYNEENNILALYERLCAVLKDVNADWELILVDDGSTDRSGQVLRSLHERDYRVKVLFLSRNFGHEAAATAGLDVAQGDAAVLMDADLQDPPELIPTLIERWRQGYDIVSGQRVRRRGETILKRMSAYLFYRLMNSVVRWNFPKDIGNFRLLDRGVVAALQRCRERNRFVRGLTVWTGFRQTTIPFDRARRHSGRSHYNALQIIGLALTGVTGYSNLPLRLASILGLLITTGSLGALAWALCSMYSGRDVPAYTFLFASIWFLGGIQCLLVGIMGEYVGRIYTECRQRPIYHIREALGAGVLVNGKSPPEKPPATHF